ncbi:MAG: T9SS type A sorting domain-containing protein [Bacteroidales bacterium]|nr:T9SS type A sorting domain-containing protein [Bacteroidales bacterium]
MKKIDFSKKLAAYGAMAVASLSVAQGQVVYHDVNPDVTFNANDTLSLDIDADGVNDYFIMFMATTSTYGFNDQIFMAPLVAGNMQMAASSGWASWNWYGSALNLNDPINSAGNWVCPGGVDSRSRVFFATSWSYVNSPYSYAGSYGNFNDGTDHYMGIMFDISGSTHYGWVRVNVSVGVNDLVLKDWAYDASNDVAILAGQMVTNLEQDVLNSAKVFSFDKQVKIQLAEQLDGTVRIFNAIGQEVYSSAIDNTNMTIDLPTAQSGIYTVVMESNNLVSQKKVNL